MEVARDKVNKGQQRDDLAFRLDSCPFCRGAEVIWWQGVRSNIATIYEVLALGPAS